MNTCIFAGRVGKDAELQYLPNGNGMAKFSLALNEHVGNGKYETTWVDFTIFGAGAENFAKIVRKGDLVSVSAHYKKNKVEKDGKTSYFHNFVVATWERLAKGAGSTDEAQTDSADVVADEDMPF